ncbi:MAG: hypothetical protein KF797_07820 [Flavobacteriales bacterium]|nr:hypothetical protein [Flavobacteriales bacterium]
MDVLRTLSSCLIFPLALAAYAQPQPFGCHHHRNAAGLPAMTDAAREQINETIARSDTFDILHYDIHLDLSRLQAYAFKAYTNVTFTPRMEGQERIRFDLYRLTVDSVTGTDGPLLFAHDGAFLDVELGETPAVGEERTITVYYHGTPHRDPEWGGFYYESGYAYNLGIGLSTIPPNFGKVWYPCFDSFVERATYTYHVRTTNGNRLHGQGDLVGQQQLGGDTIIRSFSFPHAIPTHLSAVAVSTYRDSNFVHSGAYGDIPVRLSARQQQFNAMAAKFADVGAAIDVCEHWYGQHMYDRVGYVLTTDGALEIPTNIAYPVHMTGESILSNRALYTHELGHHWWGDHVTPYVHNDMWLKEGPAEYSGHLVEEWIGGRAGLLKAVKENHSFVLREAHLRDGGFQPLSPMPDAHIYGTHTYYKGASVMHNLRGYLGDALFQQALRGVQADRGNGTMTPIQFKESLEAHSGVDLTAFFDAWVFAPGYAVFEVRTVDTRADGNTWAVDLEIGQKLYGATVMHEEVPLDVTFVSAEGVAHDTSIVAGGPLLDAAFQVPFEPAMVVLNRNTRLNQARTDHEITLVPGTTFTNLLPYVDFRLYAANLADSTLVRVEHIWCAPDQGPLEIGVSAISDAHYWVVDGLWPEGTRLEGRVYYLGQDATRLDHALVHGDENGIVLLYRPTPNDMWTYVTDLTIDRGDLSNGNGMIHVNDLRKGQYAFGRVEEWVGVWEEEDSPFAISLGPVPASNTLTATGNFDGSASLWWDVLGSDGRLLQRTVSAESGAFHKPIDVSGLASGAYILRVTQQSGGRLHEQRFEVVR